MRTWRSMAVLLALLGAPLEAYYHYIHFGSRTGPFTPIYEKYDLTALPNKTLTFFVTDQGPTTYGPNDYFGSVLSQVKQAVATWNQVSSSDLRLSFGGLESYSASPTFSSTGSAVPISNTPGGDVIFIDLPPGLIGMGAPTTSQTQVNGFYPIVRGVVMLSRDTSLTPPTGLGPSYFEAFFTTAVHEIGHALGLQHTWTGSAMSQAVVRNTSRARPLDADDIAGLSVLYGKPGWAAGFGSISGRVTLGSQPVAMASVVAIAPTGSAVSALTYPDGTYRIDGLPPNTSYSVYVHPLPPDGIVPGGEGLRPPEDQNGQLLLPNTGAFGTIFSASGSAGTLDPQQAATIQVVAGSSATVNFAVQARSAVPTYDVVTYYSLNPTNRTYGALSSSSPVIGSPAFINSNTVPGLVTAQAAAPAFLPNPQSMTILGGFAPALCCNSQTWPTIWPRANQPGVVDAWFAPPIGSGTGPRHLVFNFGNDMYVLPNGVVLVQKGPPAINSLTANQDGSVTLNGAGFGLDSTVYFDGAKASTVMPFAGSDAQGSITVLPPPGTSGQVSTVTVSNSDGQNSMMLQAQSPVTYTYPNAGAPQIASVSVTALPASSTAAVDIVGANTNFVDGQVTVGFGSDDITVRRVWVLSPTHVVADVVVAAGAVLGTSEISVISGLQVIPPLAGGFTTQPAKAGLPVISLPVVNNDTTQATVYPGSVASITGQNLAPTSGAVQLTLNDIAMTPLSVSANQITFQVPASFPTGPATLKLNNGSQAAFPVVIQIDNQPPTIVSVNNFLNQPVNGASVGQGDLLNVVVSGLDATVLNNFSRVQVTVGGVNMPVLGIAPLPNAQYAVQTVVTQSFAGAQVPVVVWVEGSSNPPAMITVR